MKEYPLYDVPYLVRASNEYYMSASRRRIRERNQAVVDDYFVARDKGASAPEARQQVAEKYRITAKRVLDTVTWFFHEAYKRKKYDFLDKFAPSEEHINHFDIIFASEFQKTTKNKHNYGKRKSRNRLEESHH